MKTKSFVALIALALTLTFSLAAAANPAPQILVDSPRINIGTQVKLQCSVGTPVEFPKITITNNTSTTVPQGKKVYWYVNSSMKGSIVLQTALAPGQQVYFSHEALGTTYTPSAWYFK